MATISLADYRRALKPQGVYVMAGGKPAQLFQALLLGWFYSKPGGQKFCARSAHANQPDLVFLSELLAAGQIKPVIDRVYPLAETPSAMREFGAGHARGKIVITI